MPSLPARTRLTIVALSLGLAFGVASGSLASASPSAQPSKTSKPSKATALDDVSRPPPAALSLSRKLKLANKALKTSKHEKLGEFPASLPTRLTPMTPRTEDGARIAAAWHMMFRAPGPNSPDGTYWLSGDEYDYTYESGIRMEFPTEPDRLYVMDCRALHYNGWLEPEDRYSEVEAKFQVDAKSTEVRSDDGHLVFAFRAEKTTSKVTIVFVDESGSTYKHMVFWGCDIGPAA